MCLFCFLLFCFVLFCRFCFILELKTVEGWFFRRVYLCIWSIGGDELGAISIRVHNSLKVHDNSWALRFDDFSEFQNVISDNPPLCVRKSICDSPLILQQKMIDTFNYKLKWEPACYKDNQQKPATDHLSKTIKSSITLTTIYRPPTSDHLPTKDFSIYRPLTCLIRITSRTYHLLLNNCSDELE